MDPKLAAILGIRPAATATVTLPAPPDPAINAGYRALGLPPIASASGDVVETFHRAALQAIAEEQAAAVKAVMEIDPNLKSDVRLARTAAIGKTAAAALRNRLVALAAPLARIVDDARSIVNKAMDRTPDRLRVEALRNRLDGMDLPGKVEACLRLGGLGDESWPSLFTDAAFPTGLPDDVINRGRDAYLAAFAGDAAATLAQAEAAVEEVKAVLGCAELVLSLAFRKAGVPPGWADLTIAQVVGALPARTKQIIEAADAGLWERARANKATFDELIAVVRPGLVME